MTRRELLDYLDWVKHANAARTGDPLWSVQAYRLAVYAIECHNFDRQVNAACRKAASLDQLTRAIGSIAANVSEGYSRSSEPDRVRFYSYALGSAREAIDWYDSIRKELGHDTDARQGILIQIRRLLLTMLRNSRTSDSLSRLRDGGRRPSESDD